MFAISIAALLFFGGTPPALTPCSQSAAVRILPANSQITLSDVQPETRVHLPAELVGKIPQILELEIQRNENPSSLAFSVAVYLEASTTHDASGGPQRVLVGNLGLYPAESNGKFALRVSTAYEQLMKTQSNVDAESIVAVLQLKRLHASRPWRPVEVVLAPLRWMPLGGHASSTSQ